MAAGHRRLRCRNDRGLDSDVCLNVIVANMLQGDVSVANQSYTSSEECYADGANRARGARHYLH